MSPHHCPSVALTVFCKHSNGPVNRRRCPNKWDESDSSKLTTNLRLRQTESLWFSWYSRLSRNWGVGGSDPAPSQSVVLGQETSCLLHDYAALYLKPPMISHRHLSRPMTKSQQSHSKDIKESGLIWLWFDFSWVKIKSFQPHEGLSAWWGSTSLTVIQTHPEPCWWSVMITWAAAQWLSFHCSLPSLPSCPQFIVLKQQTLFG